MPLQNLDINAPASRSNGLTGANHRTLEVRMTSHSVSPNDSTDNLKRCTVCGEWKPLEAFNRHKNSKDGRRASCRACQSVYSVRYYAEKRDHVREYHRGWYQANKEREKARTRDWVLEHKELSRDYQRKYRNENSAELTEYNRQYKKNNADVVRANSSKRRALKKNSNGSYTLDELSAIRAAQTDKKGRLICWYCGHPIIGDEPPPHMPNAVHLSPHLDHWLPFIHNGNNSAGNLHYMHGLCNLSKGGKHPTEIGRLL